MKYTTKEIPFTVKNNQLLFIDPCKIDDEEKMVQGITLNIPQEQINVVVSLTPLESIRELLVILKEDSVIAWSEVAKINVDSGQVSLINAVDVPSWRNYNMESHSCYWRVTNATLETNFSNVSIGNIQISSVYIGDWSWPLMGGYNAEGDLVQLSIAVDRVDYATRLDYRAELVELNNEYEKVEHKVVYRYTDYNNPNILERMGQEKEFDTFEEALKYAYEIRKEDRKRYYITGIQVNDAFIPVSDLESYWVRRGWEVEQIRQRDVEKAEAARQKAIEKQNNANQ